MVSSKIVTPNTGNSAPLPNVGAPPPSAQATPATEAPVTPAVANPTASPASSSVPVSGETVPTGSAPPNGSVPPGGSTPPNGSSPPSGSGPPPNGGGGAPPGGSPPNGSAPPSGAAPPPLIGNIVAEPGLPITPTIDYSDTVVVSAEVIDRAVDMFDQKCDIYQAMANSRTTTKIQTSDASFTPVVMIYGGVSSEEKEFPHMAALGYGDPNAKRWLCGGSLITENFVVTAAHCLTAQPLGDVRYVKLGSLRLNEDTQNTQSFNVVNRIQHEQYDPSTHYNDIALLQLDRAVEITTYVMPICLFSSTNYEDRNLIATGWGKTEAGSGSTNLHKVGLELFTQWECQEAYRDVSSQQLPLGIQEAIQLCAGSHSENKDTCQGDSGGPLQIRKNNRWYLIGITSLGLKCGVANVPGVYTRVAYYIQWIQGKIWNK